MNHLTRGPRILQGRPPSWRILVREKFPPPGVSAWLLAVTVAFSSAANDDQRADVADRSAPRARGPEGLTQAAWPVAATLLIAGVAVLLHCVGDPVATMAGSAVTALAMLVVNHYVD